MVPADDSRIRVILLDIEGTTTAVEFVYQTLFPYARRKLESFLREHGDEPEISALIGDLRAQREQDERAGRRPPLWTEETPDGRLIPAAAYAQWLMERDSKCTPLKALEGKIWQDGYARGELRGEVYADVPRAFARWRRQKREICIYSSGSVLAQRLLFRTIPSGDLASDIAGFFDTSVGAKAESSSYKKIAASLDRATKEFLFISDTVREVDAARSAGTRTLLCVRKPTTIAVNAEHRVINNFDEVFPG